MVNYTSKLLYAISDQSDLIIHKAVMWFGVTSIAVEGGAFVAEQTQAVQSQAWMDFSNYVSVVTLVGAIGLIVQTCVNIYYKVQDNKRAKAKEKREKETHDREMNKPAELIE